MVKKHLSRKIITTADGSQTLFIPELNENYHSQYGAIQESRHVFIKMGLGAFTNAESLRVFEVGFGTGLNALLALQFAVSKDCKITFETVEKYPLSLAEYSVLEYTKIIDNQFNECFELMHKCKWEEPIFIHELFTFCKYENDLEHMKIAGSFDVVFFDAFAPDLQPNLWSKSIFQKMFELLRPNGILVTYSAKGQVRRNLIAAGFHVEKLAGPPGKREMLRAIKNS